MKKLHRVFSDIYDQWVDKIYRFVFLKVGTQEVAEDLTLEVFARAWHSFKTKARNGNIGGEIENVSAFLYQIARNLIADYYRNRAKAHLISLEEVDVGSVSEFPEARLAVNSEMDRVRLAMADLKDEYREVLTWYYLDELKISEISELTGKSEQAVRVTIHRALNALRDNLKSQNSNLKSQNSNLKSQN